MAKEPIVWVIAKINPKKMLTVQRDLMSYNGRYRNVKVYIPVVKIMKKKLKGKQHFDTLPMLFDYAFFKVPKYFVPNYRFLNQMKKDIECIDAWVKDTAVLPDKGYFTLDKLYNPLQIAIAKKHEIDNLIEKEKEKTFYTAADLKNVKPGQIITLHCYPFEGLPAKIESINNSKREIRVELLLDTFTSVMAVGFENVIYSIYKDVYTEENMREDYLEDLKARNNGIDNALEGKHYERD